MKTDTLIGIIVVIIIFTIIGTWYLTTTSMASNCTLKLEEEKKKWSKSELDAYGNPTQTFMDMIKNMMGFGYGANKFEDPTGEWKPMTVTQSPIHISFNQPLKAEIIDHTFGRPTVSVYPKSIEIFKQNYFTLMYAGSDFPYELGNFKLVDIKTGDVSQLNDVSGGVTIDKIHFYNTIFVMHIVNKGGNTLFHRLFGNHAEYYMAVFDYNQTFMVYRDPPVSS